MRWQWRRNYVESDYDRVNDDDVGDEGEGEAGFDRRRKLTNCPSAHQLRFRYIRAPSRLLLLVSQTRGFMSLRVLSSKALGRGRSTATLCDSLSLKPSTSLQSADVTVVSLSRECQLHIWALLSEYVYIYYYKTKLHGLNTRVSYTDRATAVYRRS
jgi:hypothetical protein